jgi:Domain of unknown function (DUF3846)
MPVVVITPDYEVEIVPDPVTLDLKFLQAEVGGWVEVVHLEMAETLVQMWLNEEGLLQRLPYNSLATHLYGHSHIVGNVVITGLDDEGDACTLTEAEFVELMDRIVNYTAVISKWEESFAGPRPLDNPDK